MKIHDMNVHSIAIADPPLRSAHACDTHYPWQSEQDEIVEGGRIAIVDGCVEIPDDLVWGSIWTMTSWHGATNGTSDVPVASEMTSCRCRSASIPIGNASCPAGNQRLCLKTRPGFDRLVFRLATSGSIDDKTNIACFAIFARRKNTRSRADDGVFRKSLADAPDHPENEQVKQARNPQ